MRRSKLCAVLPVYLVAVVLRRIMACRNVDSRHAAQLADREGQFRRRTQGLELVCFNPIGCQRQRRFLCELRRHPAGVIGNGNALALTALLDDIIRKALGCTAHHIDVHPVDTCPDDASESRRTEFQILIETLLDLIVIVCDRFEFCFRRFVKTGIGKPLLIDCFVVHFVQLPPKFSIFVRIIIQYLPGKGNSFFPL